MSDFKLRMFVYNGMFTVSHWHTGENFEVSHSFDSSEKQILSKILWFSWQEQIQKIKLLEYYTEKDIKKKKKKNWDKIVIIMTGTYL